MCIRDRVMTYAAIVRAIWGDTDVGSTKKLQVNMATIRKKLGSRPGSNPYILNELGVEMCIRDRYCVGNVGGVFYGGADYPFHQTGLSLGLSLIHI